MSQFALCLALVSIAGASGSQNLRGEMMQALVADSAPQNAAQLKERLSAVLKSDSVQKMMQDPQLKDGMWDLLHNPAAVGEMTNDPQLAASLEEALDKDPHFLDNVIPGHQHKALYSKGFTQAESALEDWKSGRDQHSAPAPAAGLDSIDGATIQEIHSEFSRLTKEDQQTAKLLHESMELRSNLKKELASLIAGISDDNSRMSSHIMGSIDSKGSLLSVSAGSDDDKLDADDAADDDSTAMSISEIGASLSQFTEKMRQDMQELRKRDKVTTKALKKNGKVRQQLKVALKKRIKEQQDELNHAMQEEQGPFNLLGDE